ncbi:hypothetical protein HMPREF1119_2022 [Haemophilus parainfluenzae HK2019]|uniref:Uncharacterized protein n=1 Tax=Haemophilus parainfluenzae HK2019 TaxID=1095746 RepID=A0ABN0EUY5_HAEPA|nr:hypothetical protein HMPREF1118_1649 [Haemophilus parainfluenzae HK262]EIJ30268.1 hypothetical protein HMPREF1119_2022 [Haemophilus parainfluenzae HK2019]
MIGITKVLIWKCRMQNCSLNPMIIPEKAMNKNIEKTDRT